MGMLCGEKGDEMMAYFCNPLSIFMTGVSMFIDGYDLCFCCYAIKALFDVVTKCHTYVVG